ncbi:unnamed protein product [Rhizoctonia solani]|uniref:Ricin B lectin domain-containing protein n=1 Tax=Rhizoctonia solani TaxID=456999 RepID=A0A8H3D9X4_9AGAM|nr:unnamed protein product [Rhizoctonia solani]
MSAEAPAPIPYAKPPSPGTYLITSRAVPGNCIDIHPRNETRAVCSPGDGSDRQLWHIQRFGKGYKIKNLMHNVYLSASSSRENTVVETSTRPTMWNFVRTHDGYAIQYGEEDGIIDLHDVLTPFKVVSGVTGWHQISPTPMELRSQKVLIRLQSKKALLINND